MLVFFSITQPISTIIPAEILSYKYFIANDLGWQNINNQIETASSIKSVFVPNSGPASTIYFDTTMTAQEVLSLVGPVIQNNVYIFAYISLQDIDTPLRYKQKGQ